MTVWWSGNREAFGGTIAKPSGLRGDKVLPTAALLTELDRVVETEER